MQKRLQVLPKYQVVISASEQDIQEFLGQQIKDDLNPDAMDEVLEKNIVAVITEKSQGIYVTGSILAQCILI